MPERFANDFATWLTAAVDADDTLLPVGTAALSELQGGSFRVRCGTELMLVTATGVSGASPWTVTRAIEGTVAAAHASGQAVVHVLTAGSMGELPVSSVAAAALALKADLASPALTGNPTVPTQSVGNSSTRIASTAFVAGEVALDRARLDAVESSRVLYGPTATVQPLLDALDPGTEYVWNQTDGAGTLLDIVAGVV